MIGPLGTFGGIKIVPAANWHKKADGTYIARFEAHRLIKWLARFLPIKPYVEAEYIRYVDCDPVIYMGRTIYCSHAQADELMKRLK